jgi:hypothetical protein
MQPEKNLQHIRTARQEALKIFTEFDEEAKRQRKLKYWKEVAISFLYSCLLLLAIIVVAKLVV